MVLNTVFSIAPSNLFVCASCYICLLHIQYIDFLYCSYIKGFIDLIEAVWDSRVSMIVPSVNEI